jgi:hypothetical protein
MLAARAGFEPAMPSGARLTVARVELLLRRRAIPRKDLVMMAAIARE